MRSSGDVRSMRGGSPGVASVTALSIFSFKCEIMALRKVKRNFERMFDRTLTDLVHGLRNNKENEVIPVCVCMCALCFLAAEIFIRNLTSILFLCPFLQFYSPVERTLLLFSVPGEVHRAVYRRDQARVAAGQCGGQSQRRGQVDICESLAYVNFNLDADDQYDVICVSSDLLRVNSIQFNLFPSING